MTIKKKRKKDNPIINNESARILNHLNALIYVTDFDTHELLFVNEKLKQIIGNAVGKKCWQSMPFEQKGPCKFCTDSKLLLNEKDHSKTSVIKEFQHPVTQKWFVVQDQAIPWTGRLVRLTIMMDYHNLRQLYNKPEKSLLSKKDSQDRKIVHELRTPLNAILGYTQLMMYKKDYSPENHNYIEAIHHCGHQLLSMINSISKSDYESRPDDVQKSPDFFNIAQSLLQTNSDTTTQNDTTTQSDKTTQIDSDSSKVLVVDDSADNRKFVVNTLDILGFLTNEASNGQQALEMWESWKPDLIFLDIYMPELNGHDVIKTIRKKEAPGDHVIIIAVSASSLEKDKTFALESGCDDFLFKPFNISTLIELIRKYLRAHSPQKKSHSNFEIKNFNWLLKHIKKMPSNWLEEFKTSIEMLDPVNTKYHLSKLEKEDFKAASVLKEWVNQFDFERLQQLIYRLESKS